ncbi:MAG: hypothetical protein FWD16_00430 [Clostridia bacterium]|nr:hypothetical protein [Clostridia bacterium]
MPETIAQEQRRTKPKLEDFIAASLDAETRQNALAFLEYCKAKKISYPWSSTNTWTLKAKGKSIGLIWIGGDKWIDGQKVAEEKLNDEKSWSVGVWYTELLQYTDFIVKENLQGVFLNSLKRCSKCGSGCSPYAVKILEKEYRSICRSKYLDRDTCIQFKNPDAEALHRIQKMIDFRLGISNGTANRPIFDSATERLARVDNKLRVSGITDLQGNPFPGRPNEKIDYLFNDKYDSYARFNAFLFGDDAKNSYDGGRIIRCGHGKFSCRNCCGCRRGDAAGRCGKQH